MATSSPMSSRLGPAPRTWCACCYTFSTSIGPKAAVLNPGPVEFSLAELLHAASYDYIGDAYAKRLRLDLHVEGGTAEWHGPAPLIQGLSVCSSTMRSSSPE
jgi:hypothetical protein